MGMKIGFAKVDITPPVGTELGGYAGYRPCTGIHDPLHCKVVLLEQEGARYALIALDLMCVDESLYLRIAAAVAHLGLAKERLIVCAIHSHAAPRGAIPGEGPLDKINNAGFRHNEQFLEYMNQVVDAAANACEAAAEALEPFKMRSAQGVLPEISSERHTGAPANGLLTVVHFRTESGKNLMVYSLPCHPTVLNAANLEVSADFTATIEEKLDVGMGVFINGAAGDISTRFTRRESSFAECDRMGTLAAEAILSLIRDVPFCAPTALRGSHSTVVLKARQVDSVEAAQKRLEETTAQWEKAVADGEDPATQRILKTYVEGALVSLEFSQLMGDIRQLSLPVTVFSFGGLEFVSIPGELFSTLLPEQQTVAICYANGYDRYIADCGAYDAGYYEALAAILARGEGEKLRQHLQNELNELKK